MALDVPYWLCTNNGKMEWDFSNDVDLANQFSTHGANMLSPLLACCQIYREALDYLYNTTIFDIIDPTVLVSLADRCLLPDRLQEIRHLQVHWVQQHSMWTRRNEPQHLPDGQTWIRFWIY